MEWAYHQTRREYTLIRGACHATVWRTAVDGWAAGIAGAHVMEGRAHFLTLEEAQAWAVTCLAALHAEGKC